MVHIVYGQSRSPETPWPDRIDPLYEMDYRDFLTCTWKNEKVLTPELRINEAGVVKPSVGEQSLIVDRPLNMTHSGRAILIVAALSEFNHLTTAQISALVGIKVGYVKTVLEELALTGVVIRLDMHVERSFEKSLGAIWRLDRSNANIHLSKWASMLSPLDWTLISNGVNLDTISGSNHPSSLQHNLMTNELLIRAMEVNPGIIGAWGERHSRMIDMYKAALFPENVSRKNIADGVLVTRSGKIIVIEASGSSLINKKAGDNKNALVSKAAAWVAACAYSELDINVVFVDVSAKPDVDTLRLYVSYGVEKESANYVTRAHLRQKGAKKIFVADGREWFPTARTIGESFLYLRAYNAFSKRKANIIDTDDFKTNPEADIVKNTLVSLHTPKWIANLPELKLT